ATGPEVKTLVIDCYDPRAAEIPNAVAKLFGDEVFPGDIILDGSGNRVASTTTIFPSSSPAGVPSTRFGRSPSRSICSGSRTSSSPLPLRRHKLYGRWDYQRLRARTPR